MSWMSEVPAFGVALTLLFAPGAAVAWFAGTRGLALYAAAPPLSVSLVASAAIVFPFVGLEWSLWSVLAATALTVVLVCWARRIRPWKVSEPVSESSRLFGGAVCAAVGIAAILVASRMLGAISSPEAISQTFDNVFHLNAVQFILEKRSGSSLSVGEMTGGGFYPAAWHDLVSLLRQLSGVSIPVAANVLNVCIGAVVWPAGCMYLARVIVGRRPAAVLSAGVLAAAFGAFPLLMVDFGVLYPNFLALSLLPLVMALGTRFLGLMADDATHQAVAGAAFLGTLPGLALAHPSGLMTVLPLLVPAALSWWWQWNSSHLQKPVMWRSAASRVLLLVVCAMVCVALWKIVRPPEEAATWPPVLTSVEAIWDIITSSGIDRPESWAVMALTLIGLAVATKTKRYWLLGAYGAVAVLFFMAVAGQPGRIRTFLTGVWYNDPQRLAAVLPVVILPLAVLGALRCWDLLARWLSKAGRTADSGSGAFHSRFRQTAVPVAALMSVAALAAGTQQANLTAAQISAARNYLLSPDANLLDSNEMALMMRLQDEVPADSVVVGNPWNGSSLVYSIASRQTLQPHLLGAVSDEALDIFANLNMAVSDPGVCSSVRQLGADFVLDFGEREVNNGEGRTIDYDGLDNLQASGAASLVDSEGRAALYRITACGE